MPDRLPAYDLGVVHHRQYSWRAVAFEIPAAAGPLTHGCVRVSAAGIPAGATICLGEEGREIFGRLDCRRLRSRTVAVPLTAAGVRALNSARGGILFVDAWIVSAASVAPVERRPMVLQVSHRGGALAAAA
jgi:hypothetical protein